MDILRNEEVLYLEPNMYTKFDTNSELRVYFEIARQNGLATLIEVMNNELYLYTTETGKIYSNTNIEPKYKKRISNKEFIIRLENSINKLHQEKMSNNKKIIGYKAPMDLFDGEIKKGTIFVKQYAQGKEVYEPTNAIGGGYDLPKEIVEIWEPVYESQEVIVSMGAFNLRVTPDGIFHKSGDITKFVEKLVNCNYYIYALGFGGYSATPKDIIFSQTGCEKSETKLSQWIEVWNTYQKLKN